MYKISVAKRLLIPTQMVVISTYASSSASSAVTLSLSASINCDKASGVTISASLDNIVDLAGALLYIVVAVVTVLVVNGHLLTQQLDPNYHPLPRRYHQHP